MSAPIKDISLSQKLSEQADKLRLTDSYKQAAGKYINSIMIDKTNPNTYFGLAMCYKNMGKTEKAIESLEKAAILDTNNFEVFYELGILHLQNDTPCKAIKCFIQAIQIEPDNPNGIYQLGLAHEMADENDMALMIYQKLIENTPTYINSYLRKSHLLLKMELYKQALELYKTALKIDPACTKIYSKIGLCFDKLGQKNSAKRYYKKFLSAQPQAQNANKVLQRLEKLRQITSGNNNLCLVK